MTEDKGPINEGGQGLAEYYGEDKCQWTGQDKHAGQKDESQYYGGWGGKW